MAQQGKHEGLVTANSQMEAWIEGPIEAYATPAISGGNEFQKLCSRIWWRLTHGLMIVWTDSGADDRKCVPKFTFRCGISGGIPIPLSD